MDELRGGIAEGNNVMELRDRLPSIPSDLFGSYVGVLNIIRTDRQDQALTMLLTVHCALRTLTVTEFYYTIVVEGESAFPS